MIHHLRILLTPLKYLRIRHHTKIVYDWIIPGVLTSLTIAPLYLVSSGESTIIYKYLISSIRELIQILVGFFIAALAAIATFNDPKVDEVMAGDSPPKLADSSGHLLPLTRRRFLCFLFGYLAFISLALYIMTMILEVLSIDDKVLTSVNLYFIGFFFWQMIISTLIGLHFLSDRIYR